MNSETTDTLAHELIALDAAPREVEPFSARYATLDAATGYAAAHALHADRVARGWKPVGRKIGFTNRTIWPRYGVYEPMWGHVYDRTVIESRDATATVPLQGLVQPRIEPEILFCLKRTPPRTRNVHELAGSIEWIAHSIEIVHCFHPAWRLKIADCTAANGLHGRLVVGIRVPAAALPELVSGLPALRVRLFRGDTEVDSGTGANVLDSPLNALAFLVDVLAAQPEAPPLAAGEIISTGTLTDAHPVAPGETWRTRFEGLPIPGLTVTFA